MINIHISIFCVLGGFEIIVSVIDGCTKIKIYAKILIIALIINRISVS